MSNTTRTGQSEKPTIRHEELPLWVTPEIYEKACRNFHSEMPKRWAGKMLHIHIGTISDLIRNGNLITVLDYGCGKGKQWFQDKLHKAWNDGSVSPDMYDPYCPPYDKPLPEGKTWDIVICTDVMEHVMRGNVKNVLRDIISRADKVVYLSIALHREPTYITYETEDAIHEFPAHVTLASEYWWWNKIKTIMDERSKKGLHNPYIYVNFSYSYKTGTFWQS